MPVAIIAPNFFGPFAAGIKHELASMFDAVPIVRLAGDEPAGQERLLQSLWEKSRPSALYCISMRPSPKIISVYRAVGIPVVLFDEEAKGACSICCDNAQGGVLAGEWLLKKGHRRIALITGRTYGPGSLNAQKRTEGFRQALMAEHVTPIAHLEVVNYSQADGEQWWKSRPDVTAVFCAAGDLCATGILQAARREHASIPEVLAVIGFDDAPVALVSQPGLTTIQQPLHAMAVTGYKMAVAERSASLARPQQVIFTPKLIERATA